ncbi:MAG: hypothetical protein AB7G13_36630 [Lautropia sp.]
MKVGRVSGVGMASVAVAWCRVAPQRHGGGTEVSHVPDRSDAGAVAGCSAGIASSVPVNGYCRCSILVSTPIASRIGRIA